MTLWNQLEKLTKFGDPRLDGFQLNVAWPPMSEIEDYWTIYPNKFLLLQIGGKAMAEVESMERFRYLVGAYLPMINAILIDPSGGKGEPLDATKAAEYLRVIPKHWMLSLGVAGGLGPGTLHLVDPLVREFPELSIDAEGRLRTPKPRDTLDLAAVRGYLAGAYSMFKEVTNV